MTKYIDLRGLQVTSALIGTKLGVFDKGVDKSTERLTVKPPPTPSLVAVNDIV